MSTFKAVPKDLRSQLAIKPAFVLIEADGSYSLGTILDFVRLHGLDKTVLALADEQDRLIGKEEDLLKFFDDVVGEGKYNFDEIVNETGIESLESERFRDEVEKFNEWFKDQTVKMNKKDTKSTSLSALVSKPPSTNVAVPPVSKKSEGTPATTSKKSSSKKSDDALAEKVRKAIKDRYDPDSLTFADVTKFDEKKGTGVTKKKIESNNVAYVYIQDNPLTISKNLKEDAVKKLRQVREIVGDEWWEENYPEASVEDLIDLIEEKKKKSSSKKKEEPEEKLKLPSLKKKVAEEPEEELKLPSLKKKSQVEVVPPKPKRESPAAPAAPSEARKPREEILPAEINPVPLTDENGELVE